MFWYLATPYSKYPHGRQDAFHMACEQAGLLTNAGIVVFSPIAHSHPLVEYGGVKGTDFAAWERFDKAMIAASQGCIVCMATGWQESDGMEKEIALFKEARKPVVYMIPGKIPNAIPTVARDQGGAN